jgi:O-antigen/teichoic acid export membrane protein
MLKKLLGLLSDALIYGAGSVLGQLIGFLLLPLYTARLSPSDYGVLAMLSIIAAVFPSIANIGMKSSIFRFYNLSKEENERAISLGIGFMLVTLVSVLLLVASITASGWIAKFLFGRSGLDHFLRLALISAAANTVGGVPLLVLQAARRPKATTGLTLVKTTFGIALTVWLVIGLERGVAGVVTGALISDLAFMVVQIALTWRYYRFAGNLVVLRRMLAYGLPFLPYRLLVMGTAYFSTYMVRRYMGLDDAGLYSLAERFATPIAFLVAALTQAWWPYRFKIFAEDADPAGFFRTTVTYYVAAIGYLWFGVSVWGPEAIRLLTNERFHSAAPLIAAVAFIPVMQGFYQMVGTGLEVGEDTRAVPLVSLSGFVVVAASSIFLIPRLGAFGAALAATLGWMAMTAAIYHLAQRRYRIEYDWATLIGLAGQAGLAVACGAAMQRLAFPYRIGFAVIGSLLYPFLTFFVLSRSPVEQGRMQILRERALGLIGGRHHV